ncbi:MAG: endolytic transglycosylase MltG, partial [Bryobacteraceae bacterium]
MKRALSVVLVLLLLAAGYVYLVLIHPYQGFPAEGVFVDIPHGASQRTIARMLAKNGVVRSRLAFEALSRYHKGSRLEAGEYFFNRPVTPAEVFDAIANGRVYVKELVIPEGFSMFDIANLAQSEGFLTREDFLQAARDTSLVGDFAPDAPTLEGFLFPATYEFPRHMTGKDMTAAMVKRFRQVWATLPGTAPGPGASAPPLNVEKVITLASLVERETPRPEERPHVAGVFVNRLR